METQTKLILVGIGAAVLVAVPAIAYVKNKNLLAAGPALPAWRQAMLARASYQVDQHTPYQWGGGHGGSSWGLDCSGLVMDAAKAAGITFWMTSGDMWKSLPHITDPQPADIALFGYNNAAVHVMLVEKWHPDEGRAECIGAQGGDNTVLTPEIAAEKNAYVRRVPDHRVDKRFLGFCSMESLGATRNTGTALYGFAGFG